MNAGMPLLYVSLLLALVHTASTSCVMLPRAPELACSMTLRGGSPLQGW